MKQMDDEHVREVAARLDEMGLIPICTLKPDHRREVCNWLYRGGLLIVNFNEKKIKWKPTKQNT